MSIISNTGLFPIWVVQQDCLCSRRKVLGYTLVQPGLFLNYLAHPYESAIRVITFETQFDFHNHRAIMPDGCNDAKITLAAVEDLANIAVKAIEYEGEWSQTGGIKG